MLSCDVYQVWNLIECSRRVRLNTGRNATAIRQCGCYPPCRDTAYDVTYSLAKWPAETFDGEEAYFEIFQVSGQ